MSSLPPAGYDAVPLDAWTPTTVVDSDVVFSGIILLFAALALAFVLYHYLTVTSRRRQRDAWTPSGGRRLLHGPVVDADDASSSVINHAVRPVVLPVTSYRASREGDTLECAVCLAELRDGEAARFLPKCGHGFHAECVGLWLRSHPTCPLCRVDVDDTLVPLPVLLPPMLPEQAHYPTTNLPTNVLFWGSQDDAVAGAVGRPSSSDRVVVDVLPETRPPQALAPREGDAAKWLGPERLRSMWTRARRSEVAGSSSSRSCGRTCYCRCLIRLN